MYQLKATIVGTKPPVWRRLVVPESTTLLRLHEVLQAAFGWRDRYLHQFEINGVRYGHDDGEGDIPKPERVRLSQLVRVGTVVIYTYDLGDDWRHRVVVEGLVAAERGVRYPACTGGRRAGPPEDIGGVWGYEAFLA